MKAITKKIALLFLTLIYPLFSLSCGGGPPYQASADMTLTVNPSSLTVNYDPKTVNSRTGTRDIYITIKDKENRPVPNIIVYARIGKEFLSVINFTDCPNSRECSCTTDQTGSCFITFSYKYGATHGSYTAEFLIYSGTLTNTFTLTTQEQS